MRTSAILLMALAVLAIGFYAGRASAPGSAAPLAQPAPTTPSDPGHPALPAPRAAGHDSAAATDPRASLLRALELPAQERERAVRLALNAWLADDGAAAVTAIRDDPALGELAPRMMQLTLYAYPELYLEAPWLREGFPNAEQLIASAASVLAEFDPDTSRALIETHLADSRYREPLLASIDRAGNGPGHEPLSMEDAHAELESILGERDQQRRLSRISQLVYQVAANDPEGAAELLDRAPRSLAMPAIGSLIMVWSERDPAAAARWLAEKGTADSQVGLNLLADQWGNRDFEAASAFADTLSGARRRSFLSGLADAARGMSPIETLAWLSRYEGDPAYIQMVTNIARGLAREDVGAAVALIEDLPEEAQPASLTSVLPMLATENPDAAIRLIEELASDSAREELVPILASVWSSSDPQSALDWALDLESGPARDRAMLSVAGAQIYFDPDRAADAIDAIDDEAFRISGVHVLLAMAESDAEAIRLGRRFEVDRAEVLEMRESSLSGSRPSMFPEGAYPVFLNPPVIEDTGEQGE